MTLWIAFAGIEVPVHRVAEGIIEAGAVDVDRQALRRARDRRGDEAAVNDVRLEVIALNVADPRARDFTGDGVREGRHAAEGDIVGVEDVCRGRDLAAVHVGTRDRGRCDDVEFRKDDGLSVRGRCHRRLRIRAADARNKQKAGSGEIPDVFAHDARELPVRGPTVISATRNMIPKARATAFSTRLTASIGTGPEKEAESGVGPSPKQSRAAGTAR